MIETTTWPNGQDENEDAGSDTNEDETAGSETQQNSPETLCEATTSDQDERLGNAIATIVFQAQPLTVCN